MLARLRGIGNRVERARRRSTAVDPRTVHVAVENGSGQTGLGARADDALGGLGFSVVGAGDERRSQRLRGDRGALRVRARETKAQFLLSVARRRGQGRRARRRARPRGADVVLVLGRDYNGPQPTRPRRRTTATTAAGRRRPSGARSGADHGRSAAALPEAGC